MATAHLLYGHIGSGKTTFAKRLERDIFALRLSPDDWMVRLHGHNPPADRYREFEDQIKSIMWEIAIRLLQKEMGVILDFGFSSRASRDEARARIAEVGGEARLYHITCLKSVSRRRVLKRTQQLPEGAMYIDENAIEIIQSRFEPLGDDEDCVLVNTDE
jgi:predicted kinase